MLKRHPNDDIQSIGQSSHLSDSQRKLPSNRHFTTPEKKGYEVALSKQWIEKFLSKTDLRIEDNQSTEDHEEIDSPDDIQL